MNNQLYTPKSTPKKHQIEAIERMLTENILNADDQGLGKSKMFYDVAAQLIQEQKIDLVLLIVKASLRENVLSEIVNDAHQLIPFSISGDRNHRIAVYNNPNCHILIVSYETAITDVAMLETLLQNNRVLLGIDESQYVKNAKAKRTYACLRLSKLAKKTILFSGTPIPNKISDIYPQLKIMGFNVGETLKDFKVRFATPESLRDYLKSNVIRRRKESLPELNIPKKDVQRVCVKMTTEQQDMYSQANDDLILELKDLAGKTKTIPIKNLLAKLTRLNQIASNPRLLSPGFEGNSGKILGLDKIVTEVSGTQDDKLLIWTSYRKNVEELRNRYQQYGVVNLYGGMDREQRQKTCALFKNSTNHKILIAIPACAREGFTLTKACKAVYLDRSFSYLDWAQSQDRIHRIPQERPVQITVLEAENTIDQRIEELLARKSQLQAFLLGETDQYKSPSSITIEEALGFLTKKNKEKALNG